jgi:hypothetical protein
MDGELRVVAASSEAARLLALFQLQHALAGVSTISLLHERSMSHSDALNEELLPQPRSRAGAGPPAAPAGSALTEL